jgi:hypothetical protein
MGRSWFQTIKILNVVEPRHPLQPALLLLLFFQRSLGLFVFNATPASTPLITAAGPKNYLKVTVLVPTVTISNPKSGWL